MIIIVFIRCIHENRILFTTLLISFFWVFLSSILTIEHKTHTFSFIIILRLKTFYYFLYIINSFPTHFLNFSFASICYWKSKISIPHALSSIDKRFILKLFRFRLKSSSYWFWIHMFLFLCWSQVHYQEIRAKSR